MAASTPIFLNNVASTISAVASGATTTVTVAAGDGAKFGTVSAGQYVPVVIVDPSTSPETVKEYMWVTAVAGDVLTVTRAAESATAYPAGALAAGLTIAAVATANALSTGNPAAYSTGTFGKMLVPILLGTPYLVTTATTPPGTRVARAMRVRCDKAGTLKSFTYFVGASSGNVIGFVTDVGEASSGVYTKLWDSGSVAVATVNTWQKLGDPNLTVTTGQELLLWVVFDNATATYARGGTSSTAPTSLPSDLWPVPAGMTVAWLSCQFTLGSFAAPTTVSDASVVTDTVPGVFLSRIA